MLPYLLMYRYYYIKIKNNYVERELKILLLFIVLFQLVHSNWM